MVEGLGVGVTDSEGSWHLGCQQQMHVSVCFWPSKGKARLPDLEGWRLWVVVQVAQE